jgi:hypothetical protein
MLDAPSVEQDTTTIEKTTSPKPIQKVEMSPTQPHSLLHALPREPQDAIFALAVVSPKPLPSLVRLRDEPNQGETDESSALVIKQVLVTPTQPAFSRVDRSTHASALRSFYTGNTFLFSDHRFDRSPLRNWIDTVTSKGIAYGDAAKLVRSVVLEKRVRKTCGLRSQPRPYHQPHEEHVYRIAVTAQADGALSVEFGADLAGICACTMRTAALVRPPRLASKSFLGMGQDEGISEALAFAVDAEQDLYLAQQCMWQFCDTRALTACSDCGLSVHRDEKLGAHLLQWYEAMAVVQAENTARQAERAAREAEREAERIEREAEREALFEALRVSREEAEREAARKSGRPAKGGCVVM